MNAPARKPRKTRQVPALDYSFEAVTKRPDNAFTVAEWAAYEGLERQAMNQKLGRWQARGLAKRYRLCNRAYVWTVADKTIPPKMECLFYDVLVKRTSPIWRTRP